MSGDSLKKKGIAILLSAYLGLVGCQQNSLYSLAKKYDSPIIKEAVTTLEGITKAKEKKDLNKFRELCHSSISRYIDQFYNNYPEKIKYIDVLDYAEYPLWGGAVLKVKQQATYITEDKKITELEVVTYKLRREGEGLKLLAADLDVLACTIKNKNTGEIIEK